MVAVFHPLPRPAGGFQQNPGNNKKETNEKQRGAVLGIQVGLFAGLGNTEVGGVQESTKPADTKKTDRTPATESPAEPVLKDWWEITWKGWDGRIRTIECEIYQEWPPAVIGVHPWGNKEDCRGIPMFQIISKVKKPKADPRDLIKQREIQI